MTDIALIFDPLTLTADLGVASGDMVKDDGLTTAVLMSLFTDRRADPDDPVDPASPTGDRRGWPGDLLADAGDRIGSRLWLLQRAKLTEETRSLVEFYATESLQWLVDDGVATSVTCTATIAPPSPLVAASEAIQLGVKIAKGAEVLARWSFVWNAQAGWSS